MKTISQQIAEAALVLNPVELVTPFNQSEAKECFKKSFNANNHGVNPHFKYNRNNLKKAASRGQKLQKLTHALALKLQAVPPVKNGDNLQNQTVAKIIMQRVDEAIDTGLLAAAILAGDDESASHIIKKKYGSPDRDLILAAYEEAETRPSSPFPGHIDKKTKARLGEYEYNAEAIRDVFEYAVDYYRFDDWMLSLDSQSTAIDCRDKNISGRPIIVIPATRRVDGFKLLQLIGHEIECHVRDSANARAFWQEHLTEDYLPLIPLLAKSDNEVLYEGHAKYVDVIVGGSKAAPSPWYTIAIDQAHHKKSFASVAETIIGLKATRHNCSPSKALDSAWSTTRRVFRGSTDRQNRSGYAFTKDYGYYAGYHLVSACKRPEFASMTAADIDALLKAGFELKPKYENQWLCLRPEQLGLPT